MDRLPAAHRPDAPCLHRRNLDQDQHGAAAGLGAAGPAPARQGAAWPVDDHDLPRSAAPRPDRGALRAAGAKLFFLPKYSPDLNSIEMLFSKLKHGLRKAAKRTQEAVYQAVAGLLPTVEPPECANYCAKAGYART